MPAACAATPRSGAARLASALAKFPGWAAHGTSSNHAPHTTSVVEPNATSIACRSRGEASRGTKPNVNSFQFACLLSLGISSSSPDFCHPRAHEPTTRPINCQRKADDSPAEERLHRFKFSGLAVSHIQHSPSSPPASRLAPVPAPASTPRAGSQAKDRRRIRRKGMMATSQASPLRPERTPISCGSRTKLRARCSGSFGARWRAGLLGPTLKRCVPSCSSVDARRRSPLPPAVP